MKKTNLFSKIRWRRCLAFMLAFAIAFTGIPQIGQNVFAKESKGVDLSQYLQAKYEFEDAGNLGKDTSGKNNDAEVFGAVSSSARAVRGNGAHFDSSAHGKNDAYMKLPTSIVKQKEITLMTWVKYDLETVGYFARIFSIEAPAGGPAFHLIAKHGGAWDGYLTEIFGGNPSEARTTGSEAIHGSEFDEKWHHVAVTFDGTTAKFFVDGVKSQEFECTTDLSTWDVAGAYIGKTEVWSDNSYNGLMDDFRVYDKALTADEITQEKGIRTEEDAKEELPSEFLEAKYDFEDANNLGKDTSGKGNHAEVFGSVSSIENSVRNKGARFDSSAHGNNDAYMKMPSDVVKHKEITLMTWLKYDLATVGGWARVFAIEAPVGGPVMHLMAKCGDSWDGYITGMKGGDPVDVATSPDTSIYGSQVDGKWHHVSVTFNGNVIRFLVDGEQIQQVSCTADISTWDIANAYIGKTGVWGDATYNGLMDDFRVYSKALTADEIKKENNFSSEDDRISLYLEAKYDFEDTANLGKDTSGRKNHAEVIGSVSSVENTVRNNGVNFDSSAHGNSDAYMKIPSNVVTHKEITLMTWVKYDLETVNNYARIFSIEAPTGGPAFHLIAKHGGAWDGYMTEIHGGNPNPASTPGAEAIHGTEFDEKWHHVAVSYDGNVIRFFVDGEKSQEVACESNISAWEIQNAFIGKTGVWGDATYNGFMDDFRVYSKALTETEIKEENDFNLDTYLSAIYDFNDPSNLGKDVSGKGNHATVHGNVTSETEGIRGNAAKFTSSTTSEDAYMELPIAALRGEKLTVMTWAKLDRAILAPWARLFGMYGTDWNLELMTNAVNQWDGYWAQVASPVGTVGTPNAASRPNAIRNMPLVGEIARQPENRWHHLALTLDGTTMRLYLNGHLAASKIYTADLGTLNRVSAFIGRTVVDETVSFTGLIDDFRIYRTALTAEEIAEVNAFTAKDFLFMDLSFDDENNITKDESGYDSYASVEDGALISTEGKNGNAAYFDGQTSIRLADGVLLGSEGLTVSSWVKYDQVPKAYEYLFAYNYFECDAYIAMSMKGHGEGPSAIATLTGPEGQMVYSNVVDIKVGEWTHLAMTFDAEFVRIYINGRLALERKSEFDSNDLAYTLANYIGRGVWSGSDPWMNATIDDFKMYSRSLSQVEILEEEGISVPGLKMIYVDGQELLGFNTDVKTYTQVLKTGTTKIPTVTATAFDRNSEVVVKPATAIPGDTTITVTEKDNTKTVYTIHFVSSDVESNELKQPELKDVTIEDEFWSSKLELYQKVMIRDLFEKWNKEKVFDNFDKIAAGNRNTKDFIGSTPWRDSDVYRIISGAGNMLQSNPDPELEQLVSGYVERICAASESTEDGYLHCFNLLMSDGKRFDEYDNIWTHDVFTFGAMCRAGVYWYKGTGDTNLLRAATRFANYMTDNFGYGKTNLVPAHSGAEQWLLELYEFYRDYPEVKNDELLKDLTIDENEYLKLVRFWIENRGNHDNPARVNNVNYGSYSQDHDYYYNQHEPVGHAVRANLFYNGMAYLGRITGGTSYLSSASNLWRSITETQMYITGATGSTAGEEKYGGAYDLPNDGYCETCAGMSMGMFSDTMALAFAEGKYSDVVEQGLYNTVIGCVGANGNTYFYENPLSSSYTSRWSWHGVPCCPDMFVNYVSSVPRMIYAYNDTDVYVNQYIGSTAKLQLAGGELTLKQEADWAWNGTSKITVSTGATNLGTLRLRMPSWSDNTVVKVNGNVITPTIENGYAVIERAWEKGDTVEINADMTAKRVYSDPNVTFNVDRVALQRGPLIYCLEGVDNQPDGLDITAYTVLPTTSELKTKKIAELYGGVVALTANGYYVDVDGKEHPYIMTAVPFYARANRENGSVNVWIAEKNSVTAAWPPTVTGGDRYIDFSDKEDASRFNFYSSSNASRFKVENGWLVSSPNAEMKAILKEFDDLKDFEVSVDVRSNTGYDKINGGIYLLASDASDPQDKISAYNVQLESDKGNNDLTVSLFKFDKDGGWLGSVASATIGDFFASNMPKYDVNLRIVVKDGKLDVYINNASTPCLQGVDVSLIEKGSVGLRAMFADNSFDNFTVTSPQIDGTEKPDEPNDKPENPIQPAGEKDTYTFESVAQGKDFAFYHSSNGGFQIKDGKLYPSGEEGEFKAILKETGRTYQSVSVDIYPEASGVINAGLYLGTTSVGHPVDRISALGILVQSDFEGWEDAANRIDLIVGSFPEWKELSRFTSETGNNNALFTDGNKEPLTLKVEIINGKELKITLSLKNNPEVCVQHTYEYTGDYNLATGKVGIRSFFNDASFDNFEVTYVKDNKDDSENTQKPDKEFTFDNKKEESKFDFYHSSNGGFEVNHGKLHPMGEAGEFKAILKENGRKYQTISVDIYPGATGKINSGIYLGASGAGNAIDEIKALGIMVQSDFEGWEDAGNRIDLIIGEFPNWKELDRTISETGNNNALFTQGRKVPLNLKVEIDGKELVITLSLKDDPNTFIQRKFTYKGSLNLASGKVGMRSFFNEASFDNFAVTYADGTSSNSSTNTGDQQPVMVMMAMLVLSAAAMLFVSKRKRAR